MWSVDDESSDSDRDIDSDGPDSELEAFLYSQVHYDVEDENKVQDPSPILIDDEPAAEAKTTKVFTPNNSAVSAELLKGVANGRKRKRPETPAAKLNLNLSAPAEVVVLSSDEDEDVIFFSEDSQQNISLNVLEAPQNTNAKSDLWHVDADDWYRSDRPSQSFRYHTALAGKLCRNCGGTGHVSKFCRGRKKKVCALCSEPGHNEKRCPKRMCCRCYKTGHALAECKQTFVPSCHICHSKGHPDERCPDLWRRYHLTTEDGPIVKQQVILRPPEERYCFNCGRQGHFGHQCPQRRWGYPSTPFIMSYKDPLAPPEPPLVARDERRKKQKAAKKRKQNSWRLKKEQQNGRTTPHNDDEQQSTRGEPKAPAAKKRNRIRPQRKNEQQNGHTTPDGNEQATQGPEEVKLEQAAAPTRQEEQQRLEDEPPAAKTAKVAARKATMKRKQKAKRQVAKRKSYQGEESGGRQCSAFDRPSFYMPNNWRNKTFWGHY